MTLAVNDFTINGESVSSVDAIVTVNLTEAIERTLGSYIRLQEDLLVVTTVPAVGDYIVPDTPSGVNLGTLKQQPAEAIIRTIGYGDWLDQSRSEVISQVTVTVTPTTSPALTVNATIAVRHAYRSVDLNVSGGVAGSTYKLEINATTSLGQKRQDEMYALIYER